jgi:hypothetical protein
MTAGRRLGCGVAAALAVVVPASASARAEASTTTPIDRFAAVAKTRYRDQTGGRVVQAQLNRIARDPALRNTLASGSAGRVHFYVRSAYYWLWFSWPVSRVRVLRGSRTLAEAGTPFSVAPAVRTLRATGGRYLGTLEVASQDIGGFVAALHHDYPIDVVVRGRGPTHVRTSLPAARTAALPARGPVSVSGRRYTTRSFTETAWGGEPVRIWILQRAPSPAPIRPDPPPS